jgi:uncharacterized membrane protein YfcA
MTLSALLLVFAMLLLVFAMGGLVGLVAGLIGVGGGIVMVPVLYFLLSHPDWSGIVVDPRFQAVVAHATSLFVAVPTSISAVIAYHRAGLVVWRISIPLGIGAALGAVLGAQVAVSIPPEVLKAAFGTVLVIAGIRLLRRRKGGEQEEPRDLHSAGILAIGLGVGFIASMLGVGGGIVVIPFLIYLLRVKLDRIASTSMGMVVFVTIAATLSFGLAGQRVEALGPWMMGFVVIPAGLALMPGAIVGARLGAKLNQRMNTRALRVLFAVVFVILGLRLAILNGLSLLR